MVPFELAAIAENYALAGLTHEEHQAWSEVARARDKGEIKISLAANSPTSGKFIAQNEMMKMKAKIWADYFVANTAVQEATTDDGQVFSFSLTLDTEPLCRLGHQLSELLSK